MKKIAVCLLSLIVILSFAGCSPGASDASQPEPIAPTLTDAEESEIKESLLKSLPNDYPISDIEVMSYSDTGNVRFSFHLKNGTSPTYFGQYVIAARDALNAIHSDPARFTVIVNTDRNDFMFLFDSEPGEYGTLTDYRSGEPKITELNSDDDLASLFPALKIYFSEQNIDEERLSIYREVMEALNDTSRTEEEIFEEMAPNYGMTADELKGFMLEVMDEIF